MMTGGLGVTWSSNRETNLVATSGFIQLQVLYHDMCCPHLHGREIITVFDLAILSNVFHDDAESVLRRYSLTLLNSQNVLTLV